VYYTLKANVCFLLVFWVMTLYSLVGGYQYETLIHSVVAHVTTMSVFTAMKTSNLINKLHFEVEK
jgi:hypothetical protein